MIAFYDSDDTASSEETQYGVGTSAMGLYLGAQFATHDTTETTDYMTLSAIKAWELHRSHMIRRDR